MKKRTFLRTISVFFLLFVTFCLLKQSNAVQASQMPAPEAVRILTGDSVYDAYAVNAQVIQYGSVIQPLATRPYTVRATYAQGTAFPKPTALTAQLDDFADFAVSNMLGFGYKSAEIVQILTVDMNEKYSAAAITAILRVTNASGTVSYIPYASCGTNAVTCLYGKGEKTLEDCHAKYDGLLQNAKAHDAFADSALTADTKAVVTDLLYDDPIFGTYAKDASHIFSQYNANISRDDFTYLLMSVLSKHFPDDFAIISGALFGEQPEATFTDTNAPYVNMAHAFGVINGKGNGLFAPTLGISRQESAAILSKTLQKLRDVGMVTLQTGAALSFSDVPASLWSYADISFLSSLLDSTGERVMAQAAGGLFQPQLTCTKTYALNEIRLLDAWLTSFGMAAEAVDATEIISVNRSIISGEFLAPAAFVSGADSTTMVRFAAPVGFAAPGTRTVRLLVDDGSGTPQELQAKLTVYAGTHAVTREAVLTDSPGLSLSAFLHSTQNLTAARMLTHANYFAPSKPGVQFTAIKLGDDIRYGIITLTDTTAPTATAKNVQVKTGATITPKDFLSAVTDCSPVTIAFAGDAPNTNVVGQHNVAIRLTDAFGNTTQVTATLAVSNPDVTPPVFSYIPNRYFQIGETVNYLSQVKATDDTDSILIITYDASKVNTSAPGRYPVVYTATDKAGNSVTTTAYIAMTNASIERAFSYADRVLADITNSSMSQLEKARAIYNWVRTKIAYVDTGDKTDPIAGSLNAFTKGRGDCYTYYAAAEILLTRAGIQNMEVHRVGGTAQHFWHFVNVGSGWYYFDATPFKISLDGFMFTEATAKARTANGSRDYNYNNSLYTEWKIQ